MAAVITLAIGTLPPPACYANEQERAEAIIDATTAVLTGGIQWEVGTVAPVDLTLYWAQVDGNGRLLNVLKWSATDGMWLPALTAIIWGGDATGSLSNYAIAPSPAFLTVGSAYQFGRIYAFQANHTNTGAASLNVSGLGTKNITKHGVVPLVAGDILVDQLVLVQYDGTQFQMLSPVATQVVQIADIVPGTNRQFLRTSAAPATVWESGYVTEVVNYQSIPAAGAAVTLTHGFTVLPIAWRIGIVCTANDAPTGYIEGDFIPAESVLFTNLSESAVCVTSYANATVLGFVRNPTIIATNMGVNHKTTGAIVAIAEANWKVMGTALR